MQTQMKMPDLTTNESPIRIVRWLVRPGDTVVRGQPLVEVETDKATMDVESAFGGVIQQTLCQPDDEVLVGQAIALFDVEETTSGPVQQAPAVTSPTSASVARSESIMPGPAAQPAGDHRVGLFARNRAAAAAAAAAVPAVPASVPLSLAQRTAARRLQESKQSIPHFYLQTSFQASAIVAYRQAAAPTKLAWDAFFVRAAAQAIARFDRFRCRFEGDRLVPVETDAIGVAIDVENELFVIPVASPGTRTVQQISADIRRDRERLLSGDQTLRRIRPSLMTITNLGVCDVECFIPVINPPEASILGVGKVALVPVARDDGTVAVEHRCAITLSVDHRVASGRYAAEFLEAIVDGLESPA